MATIKDRIREGLKINNMTQTDLCKKTGIAKSTMSQYLSGLYEPKQKNIFKIAKALNVNESWLMGYDVKSTREFSFPENIIPIKTKKVPLLGEIAAGEPIFALEECRTFLEVNGDVKADFALIVKGDSMIDARIRDGDIVFVRKQPVVENGEIAVVLIDNEATLKRFYRNSDGVILKPENSAYQPRFYTASDFKDIKVLGKAILFQSKL